MVDARMEQPGIMVIRNTGRVILNGIRRHLMVILFAIFLWTGFTLITFSNHLITAVKYSVQDNHTVSNKYSLKTSERNTGEYSEDQVKYTGIHLVSPLNLCTKPLQRLHNIQCHRIINREEEYMKIISKFKIGRGPRSCNLRTFAHNCSHFVSSHGYRDKPVTAEELDFPLAFGLKIHKNPQQVEQLLRNIYRPHNVYCIHVDAKANESVFDALEEVVNCFDNVFLIRKYRITYSSINQSLADVACMETVVNTQVDWKYYLILSGEEFVLKTNLEIVKILKIMNGTNDITKRDMILKSVKNRYLYSHHLVKNRMQITNISKTPFYRNIPLYKGSAYGMFSRGFVRYVMKSSLSKELFEWAKDTYAPEEMIWATLNAQPEAPGGHNVSISHGNGNFLSRALIWEWDKTKCHGIFHHRCCVFSYEDLPWLVSVPQVIANKFHSYRDQLVLDCLEEWIGNKTRLQSFDLDWAYYRNLPHVKNPRGRP